MNDWQAYAEKARAKGALAKELFVVRSTPIAARERMLEGLPAHLEYQARMEAEGHLVLAGPLSDPTGTATTGEGLIVYRAPDIATARALAEADPMHRDGLRSFELRAWLLNEGGLQLVVSLSRQHVAFS